MDNVFFAQDMETQILDEKTSRRILAHSPELMLVEVIVETGGIGKMHTHPHVQATYVKSGRFRFTVEGNDREVAAGDSLLFSANALHGMVCLESGMLLDVFTPEREDFLKK